MIQTGRREKRLISWSSSSVSLYCMVGLVLLGDGEGADARGPELEHDFGDGLVGDADHVDVGLLAAEVAGGQPRRLIFGLRIELGDQPQ